MSDTLTVEDIWAYRPFLIKLAYRYTRNHTDVEDIVQDALIRAYRHRDHFTMGTNLNAWMFTILRSAAITFLRAASRRKAVNLEGVTDLLPSAFSRVVNQQITHPSAEDEVLASLPNTRLAEELENLSPRFRDVVKLADIAQYPYKEIADMMGIPLGTVMSRLHRGRYKLRQALTS